MLTYGANKSKIVRVIFLLGKNLTFTLIYPVAYIYGRDMWHAWERRGMRTRF
jgi:hypothetical protein